MPMFGLFARLRRCRQGTAAIEFAFLVPIILAILLAVTEFGRAFYQANAVEKGVRAAGLFVARTTLPLSAADLATAQNLIKTGSPTGALPLIAPGWSDASASLNIDTSTTFNPGNGNVKLVKVTVVVPFTPLMPSLWSFIGLGGKTFSYVHTQPYIGD